MRRASLLFLPLACLAALALPASAFAHGFHGGSADSVPEFVWLGIRHMLGGWDHLLFIAGIVLLAREPKLAAKLISLFVAGHSTTLLVATLGGWRLNAYAVDVVIAASVAYVGWRVLRGRPEQWTRTAAAIFGFGLVHGLGLSTRLQDLALPEGGALVARILAFNVGVEIGQLAALTALVGAGLLAIRSTPRLARARRQAARGLVAFGLLTSMVLAFIGVRNEASQAAARTSSAAGCVERDFTPSPPSRGSGGHPERVFYAPGEAPARADLEHVMGDGYIVVVYRNSVSAEQRKALADWADRARWGVVVVPGTAKMPYELEALTIGRRMTCQRLDTDVLSDFRDRHLGRR